MLWLLAQEQTAQARLLVSVGWNLSQDRHLAKYGEMFEKKGFDTVRITSTPNNTVLRLNRAKEITAHHRIVGDTWRNELKSKRPVILFALSLGGIYDASLYRHFIKQAICAPGQHHYNSIPVVGCIFDSCPTFLNFNSLKEHLIVSKSIQNSLAVQIFSLRIRRDQAVIA